MEADVSATIAMKLASVCVSARKLKGNEASISETAGCCTAPISPPSDPEYHLGTGCPQLIANTSHSPLYLDVTLRHI